MEKYFIIKAMGWCVFYAKGTMKELDSFLASIGSKITGTKDVDVVDFGLVYKNEILTETDVLGYNQDLYDELYSEISDRLSSINERAFAIYQDKLEMALHDVCSDVPVKSDRITILVSDGETRTEPNHFYIGGRNFCRFSDVPLDEFSRFVREHAYVKISVR